MWSKILLYIILLFCSISGYAQTQGETCVFLDGSTYAPVAWDNYIVINTSNVHVKAENGANYLYFDINLLRKGVWYDPTGLSGRPSGGKQTKAFNSLNLYFDFNTSVMGVNVNPAAKTSDIECVASPTINDPDLTEGEDWPFSDYFTYRGNIQTFPPPTNTIGDITIVLEDAGSANYFPIPTDVPKYYATYRWKIKDNATGRTNIKLRMGEGASTDYFSLAANAKDGYMGICTSGESLDIQIGEDVPVSPEITNLVADASGKACSGKEQTFVATVKNEYDDITWVLKTTAGVVASNAGTIKSTAKGTVTVTWADAAKGDYQLCGIPKKAGAPDGVEYCKTFTVFETPKVTLAYDNSQMCSGTTVTLKPQVAYGAGAPADATVADLTKYNWTGGVSPGTALTYSAVLTDTKKTYNFSAETPAAKGSCPVSATVDLTGKAAPVIDAITKEFPLLGTIMPDNTYLVGDMIKLSVPSNPNYKYEWTINGNKVGTNYFYIIGSATDAAYSGSVLVTDNTSGCSATVSFTLTKNTSGCGVTASITDKNGTTPVTICTNGIALLKVKANLTCSTVGNTVTSYAWYKKEGSEWVKKDSIVAAGTTENIFVARSAGSYQARVYTVRGMNKAEITVTTSGSIALADVVKTISPLQVKRGNPTVLAASSVDVNSYLWSPETMFASGGNVGQYPVTKAINNNTKFYVYGTHYSNCVSMDSTVVELSDKALVVRIDVSGSPVCNKGKARMTAVVSGDNASGNYEYAWTADSYSFGCPTDQQEAVIDIQDNISNDLSLTRVVVVKDKVTGSTGIASAQVLVKALTGPKFQFDGVVSGLVCQKQKVTVRNTNATAIASYDWYIKKDGVVTTKINGGASQVFNERGDYTVWIAAKTNTGAYCYSDTVNTKTSFAVKGFDLAWNTRPADNYKSGQTLQAEVQASGSSGYKFEWFTPIGGTASGVPTANPNGYKLEGAKENSYTFKVNVTDVNKCSRDSAITVNKLNSEVDPGLMLALTSKEVNYCNGGTAIMSASAKGGSGPYDFIWYTVGNENAPLQTAQVTASGGKPAFNQYVSTTAFTVDTKIVVKVTDASSPKLIRRDTVTVKKINQQAPRISAGDDRKIAYGSKTYLLGAVIAGTPTSWVWEDAATIQSGSTTQYPMTKSLIQETTFTAYAIDANKCTSALDDVKIGVTNDPSYALTVDIKEPGLLCNGSVVTLDAEVSPADRTIAKWAWNATLGSFNNKTIENPELTMTTTANTTTDLLVMVEDANGVTAVDKVTVIVQKSTAPDLKLEGYKNHADAEKYICSEETELKVSSTNGVQLSTCSWYVDGVEVKNSDNTPYKGLTYKHKVENAIYQTISATALSSVSCPSANKAEVSLLFFPRPVLAWASSSSPNVVQPGDAVSVTADLTKTTAPNYTYKWTHTGASLNPPGYTDGGEAASPATSATSTPTLSGGASEGTHPYYFQVSVSDKYGCQSVEIKKTISVNGNALYVAVSSKHGDYCTNGSAVLKADVVPPDAAGLTYVWYKGGTVLAGETGKELLVANPDDVSEYHVEVTAADGKSGSSAPFKLTLSNANTAPVLTGVDQKIPSGTKTALIVTTPANISAWQWQPEDKLATGESKLRSPYTVKLNAQQYYTVYGVDDNGCVGSAKILVETIAKTPPAEADPELMVKVIPSPETICVGNSLDLSTKVWTIAGQTPTYEWLPNDGNLSAYNTANPVFNPTQAALPVGIYSYTVKVTEGIFVAAARVDIHVVNGQIPALVRDDDASGQYCAGSDFVVKVQNNVGIKKYNWTVNGVLDTKVTGNTYTWPAVQEGIRYVVKVTAESNEHCRTTAALEIDEMILPALKLNPLQIKDSCGQVIIVADAGNKANYTWELVSGDTYLDKSNGKTNDTLYLKQKSPGFTTASVGYSVKVTVAPAGGGCQSVGSLASKVYFRPKVELALWKPAGESIGLPYVVTDKGTVASVSVDGLKSSFGVTNSSVSWSARANVAGTQSAAKIENIQKDDTISIVVANKEVKTCMATDSMPIYLYPEAPKVDIDTVDKSFVNVGLYVSGGSGDSYTIWSRRCDPYCLTDRFSGNKIYVKEPTGINLSKSIKLWREPKMDTLEFYYVTSERTIQGRVWEGRKTSDTVGYNLYPVEVNPTVGKASLNLMSTYFDMSAKGANGIKYTVADMFNLYSDNIRYIKRWDYANQLWVSSRKMANGVITNEFDVVPGMVLQLDPIVETKILQYGKLIPRLSTDLLNTNNSPKANLSHSYVWLHRLDLVDAKAILVEFSNIKFVKSWSFKNQLWISSRLMGSTAVNNFSTTGLLPLQFEVTTKVNWK